MNKRMKSNRRIPAPSVAIIDCGVGNVRSIRFACDAVGLRSVVTADPRVVEASDGAILPGVGAFDAAMRSLRTRRLDAAIVAFARTGRGLLGICLGMQLLMSRSEEFGEHEGLGIVPGRVAAIPRQGLDGAKRKTPHMGWAGIRGGDRWSPGSWDDTLLSDCQDDEPMYFAHSFVVIPDDDAAVVARTRYADFDFCSAFQSDGVFGCQFHPERSGRAGLRIYRNFAARLRANAAARESQLVDQFASR